MQLKKFSPKPAWQRVLLFVSKSLRVYAAAV
jgi:hypothetical protein